MNRGVGPREKGNHAGLEIVAGKFVEPVDGGGERFRGAAEV